MRFSYFFYAFIVSGFLFGESTLLQPELEKMHIDISSYQNMKIHKECTISLIPYLQVVFAPLPLGGYGGSLRLNKNHVGLQLDCNTSNADFGLLGKCHYLQVSISGVYYPFYTNNDSWLDKCNVTYGVSEIIYSAHIYNKKKCFMLGPLSIGYQGKMLFFDVGISGVDLHSLFSSEPVKIGCCF